MCAAACAPKVAPTAPAAKAATPAAAPPRPAFALDPLLAAAWKKAGITPSARADDATFLRRAYIDIAGTIPPAEVTKAFLEDPAPDKRAKLVDRLVASPEYAEHWMNYWDDVLMGRAAKALVDVDRVAFRQWLRDRFAANARWDRIVTDLVAATGKNGDGSPRTKGPVSGMPVPAETDSEPNIDDGRPVNGAVNFTLRFVQAPQDLGGTASRIFLGTQIQCAQCHDHKTEAWKQEDFRRFSSGFLRVKIDPIDPKKTGGASRRVVLEDASRPLARLTKSADSAPLAAAKPTALDGTSVDKGSDTRKALAAWMTSKQNPWFAKAFVNRMWGHFLGRGFADPVDDMRPSNPTSAPEILDGLAADFAAHDFDVAYLVRTICASPAYNLAAGPAPKEDPENKLWSRFHLVPLGPEELISAIFRATDLEDAAQKAGVKSLDALRQDVVKQYGFLFDTDEENDEPDYSGTVSQALALLNGALVGQGSRALPGSTVSDFAGAARAPGGTAAQVDALTLRVLARRPTPEERERWVAYIDGAEKRPVGKAAAGGQLGRLANKKVNVTPRQAAFEDLLWSFLNSSEFTFNH